MTEDLSAELDFGATKYWVMHFKTQLLQQNGSEVTTVMHDDDGESGLMDRSWRLLINVEMSKLNYTWEAFPHRI